VVKRATPRGAVRASVGIRRLTGWVAAGLFVTVSAAGLSAAVPDIVPEENQKVRPILKTPPNGSRVDVVADKITYDANSKIAVATGRVVMTYGKYVLVATRVSYDRRHDKMTANGSVRLKEPGGNVLEADYAQLEDKFKNGFAEHLRLLLTNDATLTAEYAKRTDGVVTVYEHVTYTRCKTCVSADGTPAWQLRSREVTHDEVSHTIYHRDATLELGGVPVFWLPYLSHPDPTVKRRSGFLIPSLSYRSVYGVGVEIPYFWNLAPNYDITFRPLITSQQGPVMHAQWRHRLADGRYYIDGAGVYQFDTDQTPPGDTHWRGSLRSEGLFDINDHWQWGWDGALVSDKSFMRRYSIDDRDEITNQLFLTGIHGRNYFSAEALQFQTLLVEENNSQLPYVLPYVRHSYTFADPVLGGELGLDTSVYSLARDEALSPFPGVNQGTDQSRLTSDIHWRRQFTTDAGQLVTPFADLRSDLYLSDNVPDPLVPGGVRGSETTARLLPRGGLDVRWPFIGSSDFGEHIITPVAQIVAADDETGVNRIGNEDAITLNFDATSLFLDDRFTGLDRYEGGVRTNLGLQYTFLAPSGGFLRASFGESFHLAGRNSFISGSGLDGTSSDLVAAIALQPNDNLRLSYQARIEEDLSAINTQEFGASLTFDRISSSVNYADLDAEPAYGRPSRQEQVWADASYNFWGAWSLFGAIRYDLARDKFLRYTVGVGYDCDCMKFKFSYSEDNIGDADSKPGSTFRVSLELKTLGGSGVNSDR
jgi:LPS-assembly protein